METYYHNEPQIEEWVEQIIEKLFATCLLTGIDSDAEYQKGCQIVAKITSLLQEFSTLPSEYLEDGLKQILEQQLPDSRIFDNFPSFQDTMSKMLHEGMLKGIGTPKIEGINILLASSKDEFSENCIEVLGKASVNLAESEKYFFEESDQAEGMEPMPMLVSIEHKDVVIEEIESPVPSETMGTKTASLLEQKVTSIQYKSSELVQATQVPDKAERLNDVLSYLFPNVSVNWNFNLMGQKFLARVEDILICLYDPTHPCPTDKFKKDGWRILVYREEDLTYPRRLEREIKNILRLGKKSIVR